MKTGAPPVRPLRLLGIVPLLLAAIGPPVRAEEPTQYAGHIVSVRPMDGTLMLDEVGEDDDAAPLEVRIRGADVVRTWRDPADPSTWRSRETSIYRWPVGTFVLVTGRETDQGTIQASKVEIPKVASE
jgi:hypothetical protein